MRCFFMYLDNFSSKNLIGVSSSLAILIGDTLSAEEISILSAFFNTLGDNLSLIASKKAIEENSQNSNC